MSRATALREHDDTPNADQILVLYDVTWQDFQRLLEIRGDRSVPRISYLEGTVEIMRPSKEHEQIRSYMGRLLETWCIDRDIDVTPFGSWTVASEADNCAAEADDCFIFGRNPRTRERPHLAIEVEWTQRCINKLEIYRKLGVEEVWYWRKGAIHIYVLTERTFARAERSRLFPDFDVELLASVLDRDTLNQAVREFRNS